MRVFYEEWRDLEANSPVATDEICRLSYNGILKHWLYSSYGHPDWRQNPERKYYIQLCYDQKLSVEELQKRIAEDVFHNQGLMPNNFVATIPEYKQAFRAIQMSKDEYLLDYLIVFSGPLLWLNLRKVLSSQAT